MTDLPARATLRDVARVAGVSISTASMALRDHPRTAVATRVAVRSAATKLRYVPNSLGRALRARRVGSIALVIPHSSEHVFSHPYFMALLDGISETCSRADLMLLLSTSPVEHDEATPYLRVLRSRAVDGVIVASAMLEDRNVLQLAASGFPAVFIGRYPHDARVDAVGVDDIGGGQLATDHLIEAHGKRRIAHLAGPRIALSALDRIEGYRTSLARHGLVYCDELVVHGDYDQQSGEAACRRLLEAGVEFDAIFVGNDDLALGALRVLRAANRPVPGEIALVSFDDGPFAEVVSPSLSSVHQPVSDLGRAATQRLIELLAKEMMSAVQRTIPVTLKERESCGCTGSP